MHSAKICNGCDCRRPVFYIIFISYSWFDDDDVDGDARDDYRATSKFHLIDNVLLNLSANRRLFAVDKVMRAALNSVYI